MQLLPRQKFQTNSAAKICRQTYCRCFCSRFGLQSALRERVERVQQDGVAPVPGVQQSRKQALVW